MRPRTERSATSRGSIVAGLTLVAAACAFDLPEPRDLAVQELPDAGAAPDASPDGKSTLDAASVRYCSTIDAAFCEDFEAALADPEYQIRSNNGGTQLVVDGGYRTTTPRLETGRAWAYVKRTLAAPTTPPASGAHLELTVTLEEAPADGAHVMIAPVALGTSWFVALLVRSDRTLALTERSESGTFTDHGLAGTLTVGARTRLSLDVTLSPPTIVVTVDGGETKNDALATPPTTTTEPSLQFGISNAEAPGGPWKMLFDDVRFDLR